MTTTARHRWAAAIAAAAAVAALAGCGTAAATAHLPAAPRSAPAASHAPAAPPRSWPGGQPPAPDGPAAPATPAAPVQPSAATVLNELGATDIIGIETPNGFGGQSLSGYVGGEEVTVTTVPPWGNLDQVMQADPLTGYAPDHSETTVVNRAGSFYIGISAVGGIQPDGNPGGGTWTYPVAPSVIAARVGGTVLTQQDSPTPAPLKL
jgi:hypothetical protein